MFPGDFAALHPADSLEALVFPFEPNRWINVHVGSTVEIVTSRGKRLRKATLEENPFFEETSFSQGSNPSSGTTVGTIR